MGQGHIATINRSVCQVFKTMNTWVKSRQIARMVEQGTCTAMQKLSLTMENNQSISCK